MRKLLFFLPFILLAEVNPFNAGVNSGYGLTPDEKVILQNKKNIDVLKKKVDDIMNNINQINLKLINYDNIIQERLSAFPTLVDEINNAMKDIVFLKKSITKLKIEVENNKEDIKFLKSKLLSLEKEIEILKATLNSIIKVQNSIIETQNKNYQTLKNMKSMLEKMLKKNSLTPKEAFSKAKQFFFNNDLDKARELFLYSLSKRYLPATSSYYLGEIAFKKKKYKEALGYYKKSIEFYPKTTSFTPRLLYHSAISFLKIGDKESAKLTFEKLINDFPNSKYADLARKELEKIK